jgi:pimeloyl-ACP methyl ester carboxylesterase
MRALLRRVLTCCLVLSAASLLLSSCFNRYIITDREMEAHYRNNPHPPQFQYLQVGDRTVHYAEAGADTLPLVLFVHGAPGAWYGYIRYMDDTLLRRHFHLLAPDRPGYGKSDYGKAEPSIEKQADMLYELIRLKRNGRKVILVGRSYGCPIAAAVAMRHPDAADQLLLLAPAIDPDHEKFWWFSKPVNSKAMRWMFPKAINIASDEKFKHVDELRKIFPLWEAIKVPTTVMQGSNDKVVDTANFYFAKKHLRDSISEFIWLPGESHFISTERYDLVSEWLLKKAAAE